VAAVLTATAESFNPMGASPSLGQFFTPSIADPIVQVEGNLSWSGSMIRPRDYGTKAKSELYWDDTPEHLRTITAFFNRLGGGNRRESGSIMGIPTSYSPEDLEHLGNAYAGGGLAFAGRVVNGFIKTITGEDIEAREVPIARSFISAPSDRTLMGQFNRALNQVKTTRLVVEKDEDQPRHPELYQLAEYEKEYRRAVEDLEEAGDTEGMLARMREFMKMYREVKRAAR
jgi:hypothetical protein